MLQNMPVYISMGFLCLLVFYLIVACEICGCQCLTGTQGSWALSVIRSGGRRGKHVMVIKFNSLVGKNRHILITFFASAVGYFFISYNNHIYWYHNHCYVPVFHKATTYIICDLYCTSCDAFQSLLPGTLLNASVCCS